MLLLLRILRLYVLWVYIIVLNLGIVKINVLLITLFRVNCIYAKVQKLYNAQKVYHIK